MAISRSHWRSTIEAGTFSITIDSYWVTKY
jgi:hypothetical protein